MTNLKINIISQVKKNYKQKNKKKTLNCDINIFFNNNCNLN